MLTSPNGASDGCRSAHPSRWLRATLAAGLMVQSPRPPGAVTPSVALPHTPLRITAEQRDTGGLGANGGQTSARLRDFGSSLATFSSGRYSGIVCAVRRDFSG